MMRTKYSLLIALLLIPAFLFSQKVIRNNPKGQKQIFVELCPVSLMASTRTGIIGYQFGALYNHNRFQVWANYSHSYPSQAFDWILPDMHYHKGMNIGGRFLLFPHPTEMTYNVHLRTEKITDGYTKEYYTSFKAIGVNTLALRGGYGQSTTSLSVEKNNNEYQDFAFVGFATQYPDLNAIRISGRSRVSQNTLHFGLSWFRSYDAKFTLSGSEYEVSYHKEFFIDMMYTPTLTAGNVLMETGVEYNAQGDIESIYAIDNDAGNNAYYSRYLEFDVNNTVKNPYGFRVGYSMTPLRGFGLHIVNVELGVLPGLWHYRFNYYAALRYSVDLAFFNKK